MAVCINGVPFAQRDGLLGLWCCNLVSQARHLLLTLRKSQLCRCGCLTWCSLHTMWAFMAWSFQALANGQWPLQRHDGLPFGAEGTADEQRRSKAGLPLMKCALLHIKGYWAEIVHTFGFCGWSHVLHPCFCYWSTKDQLELVGATSTCSGPFTCKSPTDFIDACTYWERLVTVADRYQHAALSGLLFYDKRRPESSHLPCQLPETHLGDKELIQQYGTFEHPG